MVLIAAIWARGQRCRNAKICNAGYSSSHDGDDDDGKMQRCKDGKVERCKDAEICNVGFVSSSGDHDDYYCLFSCYKSIRHKKHVDHKFSINI